MSTPQSNHIILDKELRRDIDAIIQRLQHASTVTVFNGEMPVCPNCKKNNQVTLSPWPKEGGFFCGCNEVGPRCFWPTRRSREREIATDKLREAVMWLGMDLKAINDENPGAIANPYPNSKDPSNTKIYPTADGLKL